MDQEPLPSVASLQGTLFDFAIAELVRQHRQSFPPLWTAESWAKLLIWLALSCGCSGEARALEAFAAALGPALTARMRRLFFERELPDLNLRVMADPAEQQVLVLPLEAGPAPAAGAEEAMAAAAAALAAVGLSPLVSDDRGRWQSLEALVAVPWRNGQG
ncbi:protein phosphatase [Synechococcus sp. CCAP 1479/9]|uniref:protein phosphatase n=1 Tax=Synechococcus sp. CCAP 1479/9 TaxID=1221593 RepID=UPI001C232EC1|nr:protein phosphatase [Synechococcus sp. CCAP 1479/9]